MEGSCSTGQSPQRAVVPMEKREEEELRTFIKYLLFTSSFSYFFFSAPPLFKHPLSTAWVYSASNAEL
jgi:hypothetical protein